MRVFSLGAGKGSGLAVSVLGYAGPATGDFHDDNWLHCEVRTWTRAFRGKYQASFLTFEFDDLRLGLGRLHRELRGGHVFEPLERQLVLRASCDLPGHILFECDAREAPACADRLSFGFTIDRTMLATTIAELDDVARSFPIRGIPS